MRFIAAESAPDALDLTERDVQETLGLQVSDLTILPMADGVMNEDAYVQPRRVAEVCFMAGIAILVVPSCIASHGRKAADWHNLVVFPALVLQQIFQLVVEKN